MSKIVNMLFSKKQAEVLDRAQYDEISEYLENLEALYTEQARRLYDGEEKIVGNKRDEMRARTEKCEKKLSQHIQGLSLGSIQKDNLTRKIFSEYFQIIASEWFLNGYARGLGHGLDICGCALDDASGELRDKNGDIVLKTNNSRTPEGWPGWTPSEHAVEAKNALTSFLGEMFTDDELYEQAQRFADNYAITTAIDAADSVSDFLRAPHDGDVQKCRIVIETIFAIFAKEHLSDKPDKGASWQRNLLHLIDQYVGLILTAKRFETEKSA